jgi:hypothetical protein
LAEITRVHCRNCSFKMRLIILSDPEEVGQWVATYVKKRINAFKPTADRPFVLGMSYPSKQLHPAAISALRSTLAGLPTGGSPLVTYRKLVEFHKAGELSFEHVVTFKCVPQAAALTQASVVLTMQCAAWTNMWGYPRTMSKVTTTSCGRTFSLM